jgi:plastocyanin
MAVILLRQELPNNDQRGSAAFGILNDKRGGNMNRKALSAFFGAAAIAAVLVSCGGGEQPAETTAPAATAGRAIDPATAGSVTGTVKLEGMPPRMRPINMAADPICAGMHAQAVTTQNVVVGEAGALQNVFVYLEGDFSAYAIETPAMPATLDQRGCMFEPHVMGMRTTQAIRVTNSDQTTHNVHPVPKNNREWNETQPPGAAPLTQTFPREEIAIPVKCNIHPWMQSYVAVASHPYFHVTGADGRFNLANIPPGTYTVTAWHEQYGASEQSVTLGPSESRSMNFTFSAASAANFNPGSGSLIVQMRQ